MRHVLGAALVALATLGPAQAATLVFFDGFESSARKLSTANLQQNVTGWKVTAGGVDVIGTNFFEWYGKGRYLDMNGSTRTPGRIEKTIGGLTAGKTYTLGFDYGYNLNSGTNEQLSFGIAGLTGSINPADFALVAAPTFRKALYTFKASAASHDLFFADTGVTPDDNGGPVLDNVEINAVPLPAGLPLLAAALGGLALLRRRRRA